MKFLRSNHKRMRAASFILCTLLLISFCTAIFTVDAFAADNAVQYKNISLIPGGIPFGVKFNTSGVMVLGFCDLEGISKTQNPAYQAGLRPRDVIIGVDGRDINGADDLIRTVEGCEGRTLNITYTRAGEEKTAKLTPAYSKSEGKYKTGVWVRDSGAGIGTVTYIVPDTGEFGGLGHGICDGESGELIPMERGTVTDVKINSVKKGISGEPGEIKGYFGKEKCGVLKSNTDCGVFGVYSSIPTGLEKPMPIATRDEVKCGEAELMCTLDESGRQSYKVEISSINRKADGSKCFVIKVTDKNLIKKTGGIVQGMSGSPIVQNGKLVGAVTHVMINDPTTGYGIFIENMLVAAEVPMAKAS